MHNVVVWEKYIALLDWETPCSPQGGMHDDCLIDNTACLNDINGIVLWCKHILQLAPWTRNLQICREGMQWHRSFPGYASWWCCLGAMLINTCITIYANSFVKTIFKFLIGPIGCQEYFKRGGPCFMHRILLPGQHLTDISHWLLIFAVHSKPAMICLEEVNRSVAVFILFYL